MILNLTLISCEVLTMSKQIINVNVDDIEQSFERIIRIWNDTQAGKVREPENHLTFESVSGMLAILTPKRLELLRCLRQTGAMNVRLLSKTLERDYKNVYIEVKALEDVGLVQRTDNNLLIAPWDVIDAHVSLVA